MNEATVSAVIGGLIAGGASFVAQIIAGRNAIRAQNAAYDNTFRIEDEKARRDAMATRRQLRVLLQVARTWLNGNNRAGPNDTGWMVPVRRVMDRVAQPDIARALNDRQADAVYEVVLDFDMAFDLYRIESEMQADLEKAGTQPDGEIRMVLLSMDEDKRAEMRSEHFAVTVKDIDKALELLRALA